jgi:hypothetical protein
MGKKFRLSAKIHASAEYPPIHIKAKSGDVRTVYCDHDLGGIIPALILSGRMSPKQFSAEIEVNGDPITPSELAKISVLIDVPGISSPEPSTSLSLLVSEELAFAGQKSGFRAIDKFLIHLAPLVPNNINPLQIRNHDMSEVPAIVRFRTFLEIATQHKDAKILVWVRPDLHEIHEHVYRELAEEYAQKGFIVILVLRGSE